MPLAAPIGHSPLLILTLCGSEHVLVVSTEPPDDLSCLTPQGPAVPGEGVGVWRAALLSAAAGAYCSLATSPCPFLEPSPSAGGGTHWPLPPSCPPRPAWPILTSLHSLPLSRGRLCQRSPTDCPCFMGVHRRATALAVGTVGGGGWHKALVVGGGGGGFERPTQIAGKPRDPEIFHPPRGTGEGGCWTPPHPPTHLATHSAPPPPPPPPLKKIGNFSSGAFGADPLTLNMSHPNSGKGGGVGHPPTQNFRITPPARGG